VAYLRVERIHRTMAGCGTHEDFSMTLKLVIGNKNYSSWSMRPWLAARASNIAFDEVFIPLYTGDADKQRILSFTPSGKVPVLVDGDVTVWDSLAIIEYLAERFAEARLWPEDAARRAHARSISAEMHSGFPALRNECGMNLHRPVRAIALSNEARADIARVQQIWSECRERLRDIRAVSVRRLQRRRRHVRAGGASLSHLCDRRDAGCAGLHGYDDVAAGLSGVDARGPRRNHCHREVRERVSLPAPAIAADEVGEGA
jgi:glutathione S-transferase